MTAPHRKSPTVHESDNEALVLACRVGDETAWNTIVDRYQRLVYAVAMREGLNPEQAADVSQESFGSLFQGMSNIDDPDRLGSWLMTVARRHSWRIRGNENRLDIELSDTDLAIDDQTGDLAQALWVYEAVEQLEEPCRTLIGDLFFDTREPTYGEVAERLGRPLGSIGPLRARCLDRLRAVLEADGSESPPSSAATCAPTDRRQR